MALGLLVFQDLAVVVMVLLVPMLAAGGGSGTEVVGALAKAAALIAVVLVVARRLMPAVLEQVARTCSPELFLLTVIAVCLGTAWVTSLAGVSLSIVGGHVATRREVERELREHHELTDFLEVAPSSEDHVDRARVRDRVAGRDLVAVIAGYTGHDLTNLVRELQRAGEITGRLIWPKCRGKSGVVREILAAASGG